MNLADTGNGNANVSGASLNFSRTGLGTLYANGPFKAVNAPPGYGTFEWHRTDPGDGSVSLSFTPNGDTVAVSASRTATDEHSMSMQVWCIARDQYGNSVGATAVTLNFFWGSNQ